MAKQEQPQFNVPMANPVLLLEAHEAYERNSERVNVSVNDIHALESQLLVSIREWEEKNDGLIMEIKITHDFGITTARSVDVRIRPVLFMRDLSDDSDLRQGGPRLIHQ